MTAKDLIWFYREDPYIQSLAEYIKPNQEGVFHVKGISGSMDALVAAAIHQLNKQTHLFIVHEKEDAAYFVNDLQNLMGEKEVLLFPSSYKRPYELEEVENANILMRAEILNKINHKSAGGEIIVTYPEALTEKVINKRSLTNSTYTIKTGDEIDTEFLAELLISYDFEPGDFVYEAGQYAIRGGIIDIFSYANDLPYRIELFGNEVESIRSFDPNTQLSIAAIRQINIIPNVQTRLLEETRQSFLDFLPKHTKVWFKDYQHTLDVIDKQYENAVATFETIISKSMGTGVVMKPEDLFENAMGFVASANGLAKIEYGNRQYLDPQQTIKINSEPQASYNKNFELIAQALNENQLKGITNIIVADSMIHLEKLKTIFSEVDPFLDFRELNLSLRQGFIDKDRNLACFTDHQLFERFHRYKVKEKHSKSRALTIKELKTLQPGDYVTHIDHGIGRFVGMEKKEVNGKLQESIRLVYKDDDLLYVSIYALHKISKYSGKEGVPPSISKLGSAEWENKKTKVKKKVKDIAKELIELYARRKTAPGFAFSKDGYLQAELETSFIYDDTPDQAKSTEDIKADMQQPHPMDRLVCGDVGFGKTEVAIRAAFKAVNDSKQVAVLVPTTILAMQHYRTFNERLKDLPVTVAYINRFKTTKEIKETLAKLKDGSLDIIIGTHRIVNKDVVFKDLGLLVIDEEQKFGVKVKDRLKELRVNVDVLTLTATPIPRTLHFSLMGARDLSVISTPPPNRQPVTTQIQIFKDEVIRDAISYELRRGGQVFFVHNRIKDIDGIANIIIRLVPDARVAVAHGQMDGSKLEKIMVKFIEGEYDVLVSTNIIESGLDIPNANTIVINQAHMFGLSDLHQMRGRVGRSNKKAFCYLLTQPTALLTTEARKRLTTLEEFSDLGDGFKVAMRDLDIRGAGNMLGAEQSGFISDLGFEAYHKILDEAVQELKETDFKDLFTSSHLDVDLKDFVKDCSIETDMEVIIPDEYVSNISERLHLYNELDNLENEEKLQSFIISLVDRFGKMPHQVEDLIKIVRIRWKAEKLGLEKVIIKGNSLKGQFVSSENSKFYNSDVFGSVLQYIKNHPRKCRIKDVKNRVLLIIDEIRSVDQVNQIFTDMLEIKSLQMQ
ncbi:MAG: transcription-repair coupling factor [Cyclobacteriaceae bacterium]